MIRKMPRTTLKREKYMARDTADLIRNKMRHQEITQQDIGDMIGRAQSNVSARISQMSFSYSELVGIFDRLGFTEEEIIKCMKK